MLTLFTIYLIAALGIVALLCAMLMRIGNLMASCPVNGPAIRVGVMSTTTGFAAIGTGGAILIATILPYLSHTYFAALTVPLGLAALCLGLGFTQAVATLRALVDDIVAQTGRRAKVKPDRSDPAQEDDALWT